MVGITDKLNNRLEVALNYCIRFIFKIPRWLHISPYRANLGWLKVKYRRLYFIGCVLYKILHFKVPPSLVTFFKKTISENPKDNLIRRSNRNITLPLIVPRAKVVSNYGKFPISAAQFWNELPLSLSESPSLHVFKDKLLTHLLATQYLR